MMGRYLRGRGYETENEKLKMVSLWRSINTFQYEAYIKGIQESHGKTQKDDPTSIKSVVCKLKLV